jgi:uncharacterized membrane protein
VVSTVEEYLAQLRATLAGSDPALVQDALYDAEEYLRNAVAEADAGEGAVEAAVESYGSPEEVASAYRDAELTVAAAMRKPALPVARSGWGATPLARFFGIVMDPAAWGALLYMLLSLATGVLYFTIVVTGVSLTLGLLVLIIGVPFALLFLGAVRALSLAEGRLVEGMLGQRMPRRPRMVGAQGNLWERVKSWLGDPRTWLTMLYMVLQLPLGIVYFTLMVTALSVSAAFVAAPIVQAVLGQSIIHGFQYAYYITPVGALVFALLGVLGIFASLWLAKGIGTLHGAWAKLMLVGRLEG